MRKIIIFSGLVIIVLLSCFQSPTEASWILLNAPYLMNDDEPGTGTPYLRAPLSDWKQLGNYPSYEECATAIWKPKSDPNYALHRSKKLTITERALGFACVKSTDSRLSSPPRYDLMKAAKLSDGD